MAGAGVFGSCGNNPCRLERSVRRIVYPNCQSALAQTAAIRKIPYAPAPLAPIVKRDRRPDQGGTAMQTGQWSGVLRQIRRAALLQEEGDLADGQLLDHFLAHHDETAFEALVRRHGPMVMGVCRRVLRNSHDAEDAFQATFLVLVRKAASVVPREMVGNWLYGVAYRTALGARTACARRRAKEREMPRREALDEDIWSKLRPLLDHELSHLPDKYRVPIVLCALESKSRKEAARQLGWSEGTLSGRLARARILLAKRLSARGLTLSGGALAAALAGNTALASVPSGLLMSTVKAATLLASG